VRGRQFIASAWLAGGALVLASGTRDAWAKTFNADQKLKVFQRLDDDLPDRLLGFTPAPLKRIWVPNRDLWYVAPIGALSDDRLSRLGKLLHDSRIPGLDLSEHWDITNDTLSFLSAAPQLQMLVLARTRITDAGLGPVASLKELRVLVLNSRITDDGLQQLQALRALQDLSFPRAAAITDKSCGVLSGFGQLEHLDLSGTKTTDACIGRLAGLKRVKSLVLGDRMTDKAAASLARMRSLESLDLSQTHFSEKGLAVIAALPKLTTLFLNPQTTDAGVQAVSGIPTLRTLDLTRSQISDESGSLLERLRGLQELALSQTRVSDASLHAIAQLTSLRLLEISGTLITSAGLRVLSRLPKFVTLSLSWPTLQRDDIENLAALPKLRTILLNGLPLSPAIMDQISGLARAPKPVAVFTAKAAVPAKRTEALLRQEQSPPRILSSQDRTPKKLSSHSMAMTAAPAPAFSTLSLPQDFPLHTAGLDHAPDIDPAASSAPAILEVIPAHSSPRASRPSQVFGGVRRVREAESNIALLNDLIVPPVDPPLEVPDERADHSLGTIEMDAKLVRRHRR
jgi:Leucine-rich repeat (LRR) protein